MRATANPALDRCGDCGTKTQPGHRSHGLCDVCSARRRRHGQTYEPPTKRTNSSASDSGYSSAYGTGRGITP